MADDWVVSSTSLHGARAILLPAALGRGCIAFFALALCGPRTSAFGSVGCVVVAAAAAATATARLPPSFARLRGCRVFVIVVAWGGRASSNGRLALGFIRVGLARLGCGGLFGDVLVVCGVLILEEDLWLVLA